MKGKPAIRRRDASDRAEQPAVVEPFDPFEDRELDVVEIPRRSLLPGHLRLEELVDRLGERVVIRVPDAADRGPNAGFSQWLRVANAQISNPAVAMVNQLVEIGTRVQRLLERIERQVTAKRVRHTPAHDPAVRLNPRPRTAPRSPACAIKRSTVQRATSKP